MNNTQISAQNNYPSDLSLEIDEDLYQKLSKIAQQQNTTVELVVENFLRQYIDEHQK